jgi:hypothetical protein
MFFYTAKWKLGSSKKFFRELIQAFINSLNPTHKKQANKSEFLK